MSLGVALATIAVTSVLWWAFRWLATRLLCAFVLLQAGLPLRRRRL